MIKKVVYTDYPALKQNLKELISAMEKVNYHTEKLTYNQRMRLLSSMEASYRGLHRFADDLLPMMAEDTGDERYHRYFLNALAESNYIKVSEGKAHDYVITAPPLGDRYVGNAAWISAFTEKAIERAIKKGARFNDMSDVCVIVKQYCCCAEVAMGTTENREIHSITDTVIKRMGLDDNAWRTDCCYVWAESPNPRTEIIITDREHAKLYNEFVSDIYEKGITRDQRYWRNDAHKKRMIRNVNRISAIINEVDDFTIKYNFMKHDTGLHLARLSRALAQIITDLRAPYISSAKHEYSHLYTTPKPPEPKKKRRTGRQMSDIEEIIFYEQMANRCVKFNVDTNVMTIETEIPKSLTKEAGKDLCDTHEFIMIEGLEKVRYGPMKIHDPSDLTVTINLHVDKPNPKIADPDNLNLSFLRVLVRRVKIIYIRNDKKSKDKEQNCTITICPKSSVFRL